MPDANWASIDEHAVWRLWNAVPSPERRSGLTR